MKRVRLIAALCISMLILTAFPGRADAADIITRIEVGFNSAYKMENWTPVRVRLENTGPDIEGSLEVVVPHYNSSISYSVPVVIPGDTTKEYTVMVKIHGIIRSLDVMLKNKSGRVLEKQTVRDINTNMNDVSLLGIVTDDGSSLGYFRDKVSGFVFSYFSPVTISAGTFPDKKEILDNFGILIINNLESDSLTKDQKAALNAWLKGGGVLIIGTGINGSRTLSGLNPSVVPVSAGDLLTLDDLSALEDMSGLDAPAGKLTVMDLGNSTGEPVLAQEDQVLVKRMASGKGYIYISAFDLGTEPYLSWEGNLRLWDNLLNLTLPQQKLSEMTRPNVYKETPVNLLAAIPAMDLPPITYILFIFLLYLGMAGPLNYLVLKKIDRREWSWFTIPALSIVFAVLIYAIGFGTKGNEVVLSTISVIEMDKDSGQGTLTRYMGVFMPTRGDYKIDIDSDGLISLVEENSMSHYPQAAQGGDISTRIIQGRPSQIVFEDVNVWMMKTFMLDGHQVDAGTIDSDLKYENGKITGTVTNNTGLPLEDFIVYTPYSYKKIGNIAAGESKSVELDSPVAIQPGFDSNYYMMLEDLFPYYGRYGGSPEERDQYVRRRLFSQLVVNEGEYVKAPIGESKPRGFTVEFFAFYDPDDMDVVKINDRRPESIVSWGVVKGTLDADLETEGQVFIPPGYIYGEYDHAMSNNTSFEGSHVVLIDRQSYAVFSVDLSPYKDLKDLKALISVLPDWGNISIMVYDQAADRYVPINDYAVYNDYTLEINDENKHLLTDERGMVYLRVSQTNQEFLRVSLPNVSVEGRTE